MPAPASSPAFRLSPPITPASLSAFSALVIASIDAGTHSPAIDLDDLAVLDSPTIAGLITILRAARERGGSLVLATSRPSILATLATTGLDRVFSVVRSPDSIGPKPTGRRTRRAVAVAVAIGALAASLLGRPAMAQNDLAPAAIIARIIQQNPAMHSYQAHVNVDFKLRSFPYFSQHLEGTTYFKRPDNFEVVFERVPAYAKGFDKLYADIGDPTSWEQRYNITLAGERTINGHRDLVLRMNKKVRGQIDHQDVFVDPVAWHIDQMEWFYYNGGFIAMSQDFKSEGAFSVISAQHSTIRIPHISASVEANYTNYHTNVAIDDNVFTKNQGH